MKTKKRMFFCSKCKKAFEMKVSENFEYKNEEICGKCRPKEVIFMPYVDFVIDCFVIDWKIKEEEENDA